MNYICILEQMKQLKHNIATYSVLHENQSITELDQEHYWRCNFIKKNIGDAVYLNHACTFRGSYARLKPLNVSLSFKQGIMHKLIQIT